MENLKPNWIYVPRTTPKGNIHIVGKQSVNQPQTTITNCYNAVNRDLATGSALAASTIFFNKTCALVIVYQDTSFAIYC